MELTLPVLLFCLTDYSKKPSMEAHLAGIVEFLELANSDQPSHNVSCMVKTVLFLLAILLIIALIWGIPALGAARRSRLKNQPFPRHWVLILERNLPIYKRLTESLSRRLHGHINVFLAEKQFIGCGGLRLTDEIKLTIAAVACLLLLNERGEYYPKLSSILVYPSAYRVKETKPVGGYVVQERTVVRIGESWARDQVVLSWEDIKRDATNWSDGRNVILHEFAHQLDQEDGRADGVPILEVRSDYLSWARVFKKEYQRLLRDVERGQKTVMERYGATDPAEFFAVATETFFEKPLLLKRKHPELYRELKRYYKLEPLEWI